MSDDVSGLNAYLRQAWEYARDVMQYYTGVRPTLTSAHRSGAEQQTLYDNRASNPYPVNRPGDSAHGVARSSLGKGALGFDSWVPDQTVYIQGYSFNSWEVWTYIRRWIGLRVPDNDRVHAELPNWRDYFPEFD